MEGLLRGDPGGCYLVWLVGCESIWRKLCVNDLRPGVDQVLCLFDYRAANCSLLPAMGIHASQADFLGERVT